MYQAFQERSSIVQFGFGALVEKSMILVHGLGFKANCLAICLRDPDFDSLESSSTRAFIIIVLLLPESE